MDIQRVLRITVMLFAVLVALDKLGFQVAPLVAGIGVAGIGIGFAVQGVLGNVVAGLTIIFTKPFRVGEYVEIVGVRGDVAAVELFSTHFRGRGVRLGLGPADVRLVNGAPVLTG